MLFSHRSSEVFAPSNSEYQIHSESPINQGSNNDSIRVNRFSSLHQSFIKKKNSAERSRQMRHTINGRGEGVESQQKLKSRINYSHRTSKQGPLLCEKNCSKNRDERNQAHVRKVKKTTRFTGV